MMNLQDIMVELSSYSVGCRIMDGYIIINITYDAEWSIIPPHNEKIEFAQKDGKTYYAAPIQEVSFDEVFNSIKETIDYNIDLQKKLDLYRLKVNELQEIFANENLDTLASISFEFGKKKDKRKYTKKKKPNAGMKTNTDDNAETTETIKNDVSDNVILQNENNEKINDGDMKAIIAKDNNKVDYMEELNKQ